MEKKFQVEFTTDNDHLEAALEIRPGNTSAGICLRRLENKTGGIYGIFKSPYILGASILISLGGFTYGYEQSLVSVTNVTPQFYHVFPETDPATPAASFHTGLATAMIPFGAFISSFFMPVLLDRCSRRWALTMSVIVYDIGAVIQTAAHNYTALVCGRLIGGLGAGALVIGAPLYISEISPPELRGTLLVLQCISMFFGNNAAYWIAYGAHYIDSDASFRLPFGLRTISASLVGILIHFFPDSPRGLCLVGKDPEALIALSKLRRKSPNDLGVRNEWQDIKGEVKLCKDAQEKAHHPAKGLKLEILLWADLFKKGTIRRTLIGIGVCFFQQFSGMCAFTYYGPILFQRLVQPHTLSLILAGLLNLGLLVGVIGCFLVINRIGRRPLAILGALGMMGTWIVNATITGLFASDWDEHAAAGWISVTTCYVFTLIYGASYAPLGWCLPSEIFTTTTRAKGVALSASTFYLCNFVLGIAVPHMLDAIGYGVFIFFAAFCGLAATWAYFFVPETEKKSLEQINASFGHGCDAATLHSFEQMRGPSRRPSSITLVESE